MKAWAILLACAMAVTTPDLWAKRLAGGMSIGKQSANVTQRSAAAPTNAAPAPTPTQSTAQQRPATAPAATPAPAPRRPWGAMLGGLAAGLGLAWLAQSLGLGEAFGQFLLIGLFALLVMALFGWVMRARQGAAQSRGSLAYQGASAVSPRDYSPQNVGNDASARPWERSTMMNFETAEAGGAVIGSALAGPQGWGVPAGFDAEGFLRASKTNFVNLQVAWDRADIPALRAMMTDGMLDQIKAQLAEREQQARGETNHTDVVMLEAQLLGIEELDSEYMASVEFSGLIREDPSAGPNPFREVWNITRPKAGPGGWLVAGVQALQ